MDTVPTVVILCYIVCLVIALTIVTLSIVHTLRPSPPKGTRKQKRQGVQRKQSARKEKTESRSVLKSSPGRGTRKRAISSGEKPLKPGLAASEPQPEALETWKSAHSEGSGPWSGKKRMPTRNKAGEQTAPIEARKQVQPKNAAPFESSESKMALKDGFVSHTALPGAPQGQSAIVKPKSTAPVQSSEPRVTLKDDSVKHTAVVGAPQPQAAFTVSRSGQKPAKEPLTDTVEPAQVVKENESSTDIEPDTKDNQASSEPPEGTADSGETDQETPQTNKSSLGDLADLFATSASDFSEKSKLAEQVDDVDVNDILQEGLGLLGKVKKHDD